ncbi:MAG: DEAD/DEAH box helicase [Beijerinckiaceae bacterium]
MPVLDINTLALWPHQRSAVVACDRYFDSGRVRSALVHMPTGTGKTGIMATISTRRAQNQPVLIICPSIALVHQLITDFQTGFWDKIGAPPIWAPEQTLHLLPTRLNDVVTALAQANDQRKVVFATVQTLQQIHARPDYASLQGLFGTVLFDEGHREPAPAWAQAVRQLDVPTILFSATPFRNDLKLFDVDMDYVHFLSFQDATTGHLIRDVEIHEQDIPDDAGSFPRAAITTRDRLIAEARFTDRHKMIIRANQQDDIEALFAAFNRELGNRTDGVLALHINFSLDGPVGRQRRPDVPDDLRTRPERFLIHQYMLTEGIDDPACTMLALYEPFSTERQLVQQVGRLTRHDGQVGTPIPRAFVLARTTDNVPKMWEGFIAFDQACIRNNGKPPVRNDSQVFDSLVNALPEVDYVFGKFRTRIDFDDVDLEDELRVPNGDRV